MVTTGRLPAPTLCLFADRKGNTFLQSSFVTAKMHVHTDVCKGKVRGRGKKQDLASLETFKGAGPSYPTVMGWLDWSENFYQNQNFAIIVPKGNNLLFCCSLL